jgi:hypothetical protein
MLRIEDYPRLEDAKIILDSINEQGDRLTTMELTFIRWVLAEFNTHRSHSRNSASSRAIPVLKQLAKLRNNPAFPLVWASEQKGMQGGPPLVGQDLEDAQLLFMDIWQYTLEAVEQYVAEHPIEDEGDVRLHKSLLNRLLEPFMWHTVIATSTQAGWENFFQLRSTYFTRLAQPEIALPADLAYQEYQNSQPKLLLPGEWHTPYILPEEYETIEVEERKRISVARSARVSFLNHDGVRDVNEDLGMFDRLIAAVPRHDSPMEHVATPAFPDFPPQFHLGNFKGWHQLRHLGVSA